MGVRHKQTVSLPKRHELNSRAKQRGQIKTSWVILTGHGMMVLISIYMWIYIDISVHLSYVNEIDEHLMFIQMLNILVQNYTLVEAQVQIFVAHSLHGADI